MVENSHSERWNVASDSEELTFNLILINLNFHLWQKKLSWTT